MTWSTCMLRGWTVGWVGVVRGAVRGCLALALVLAVAVAVAVALALAVAEVGALEEVVDVVGAGVPMAAASAAVTAWRMKACGRG